MQHRLVLSILFQTERNSVFFWTEKKFLSQTNITKYFSPTTITHLITARFWRKLYCALIRKLCLTYPVLIM